MVQSVGATDRFSLVQPHELRDEFAEDVRSGLTGSPKTIPPKYFYDDLGSALFDAICHLPEYYVSRAEIEILRSSANQIAESLGAPIRLIELGSGNSRKTRLLLDKLMELQEFLEYIPIDIDGEMVTSTALMLLERYPRLTVRAIAADFKRFDDLLLPVIRSDSAPRNIVLFLGSTIGNLEPSDQLVLLRAIRRVLRPEDAIILGADLRKESTIVEPAYDDALHVTAAFNLNVLVRINRQLGGHFDLNNFRHRAFFNHTESRIEMHIVSPVSQRVPIEALNLEIAFAPNETIHTENSYKFDEPGLAELARAAGFEVRRSWTDSLRYFLDLLLVAK